MEYINEINLNAAIIHVLDNNAAEPVYNEFQLKLMDETYEYILKHIQRCLKDEDLKYAVFNDNEENEVRDITKQYFDGHIEIVEASKSIANRMFRVMKTTGNVPSCDLVMVSISTEYGLMFAILKMDYVKNYTHSIDFIEDKIGINIIPQFGGLPGTQKLQKCAFIKPYKDGNKFDLMIIDKQSRSKDAEDYGSNYFSNNFLDCTIVLNERDSTRSFLNIAEKWTRDNLKDDADQAERVRTTIKKRLKEEDNINIKAIAKDVLNGNEAAENFTQYAKERGVPEVVEVDKDYISKKLQRIKLKIDKEIDLYIDEEAYNDKSKFEVVRNGDGTINLVIKHVKNYIEK